MVSDKVFSTDGTQNIFSSDFKVISEDHLRVFLDGVVQSRDDYDLINNAAVFHTAPTAGQTLTLQVGTTPGDILVAPTEAGTVAANITNVNTVADISGDVTTVAGISTDVTAVVADAVDIGTVATNITNVNNVGGSIADVNAVALDLTNVDTVATNIADVNTTATDITNVNTVGSAITNVNTVATNVADVNTVASSIGDVNRYANEYQISATAPATPSSGDFWYDSTNNALKFYDGATWVDYAGDAANSVILCNAAVTLSEAAYTGAEALFDQFGDQYLGTKAGDPTLDNDGDALTTGDLYWNTTDGDLRVWTGSAWAAPSTLASTSASNAATSETNAATSETNAAASEAAAATSETNAATSETNAATSETNAATSETNAATSETNAAASEVAAAATYDAFDDRYLGDKAADPSVDNDGDALLIGAIYYNTTLNQLKVWNGSLWDDAVFSASGTVTSFNARQGSVSLNAADVQNALGFDPQNITEIEALSREEVGNITKDMKGFPNLTDSTIAFNEASRVFTLAPAGASFDVYYRGELITISSTLNITITNTTGDRYIKYNPTTGQLEETTINGNPSILDDLLVAYIFWDATNGEALIFGEERHSSVADTNWHLAQHLNVGAVWRRGGGITYTADNDDATIALGSSIVIADEDLVHTITHSATPSGFYEQVLEGDAQLPTIYLDGTAPAQTTPTTVPWVQGTARVRYNPVTAGSGSLVDTPNNNYVSYWIVATNDTQYPIKAVMGHYAHSNVEGAEAEEFDNFGFSVPELVPMYQVILRASTGATYQCQIDSVYTITSRQSTDIGGFTATSHNSLTARSISDQHPIAAITGLQTALDGKEAADATILKDADIGVNVQAYDATIVVDADIGSTVQAYDADTTKNDVANTFTASQTFGTATITTANITTVDLGDWTVTESAGVLYFANSGTNKMKIDASGNLTVAGDVTAFGTI